MTKITSKWKCESCSTDDNYNEVCIVCSSPNSTAQVKITKRDNKHIISKLNKR